MQPERLGNPKRIKAAVNIRESPAAHWFHKDLIGLDQYRAATIFRMLWERTGATGAPAFDWTKPFVDGGRIAEPYSISRMDARKKLRDLERKLGQDDYDLIRNVCGACIPLKQLFRSSWEQRTKSRQCRKLLNVLVAHFDG